MTETEMTLDSFFVQVGPRTPVTLAQDRGVTDKH